MLPPNAMISYVADGLVEGDLSSKCCLPLQPEIRIPAKCICHRIDRLATKSGRTSKRKHVKTLLVFSLYPKMYELTVTLQLQAAVVLPRAIEDPQDTGPNLLARAEAIRARKVLKSCFTPDVD